MTVEWTCWTVDHCKWGPQIIVKSWLHKIKYLKYLKMSDILLIVNYLVTIGIIGTNGVVDIQIMITI